jgi:hypothetical protein
MADQRVKGQEVNVLFVRGGVLESSLTNVQDASFEIEFEVIRKKYLGNKSDTLDDIYNGTKGDYTLHLHNQEYFAYLLAIKDRAQRKTPDVVFNITAVLAYPNGQTPSILVPDIKFSGVPIKIGGRGEQVEVKHSWEAEDFDVQL